MGGADYWAEVNDRLEVFENRTQFSGGVVVMLLDGELKSVFQNRFSFVDLLVLEHSFSKQNAR